jgi:hypothetical protein
VDYPDALRELGARSYICVPMIAREKAIGAVTYVRGAESPVYGVGMFPRAAMLATGLP